MANSNYTSLQRLPDDIYTEGSPFIIKAGALLKSKETDQVLLQLKFKNISDKPIKATSVKVTAGSVTGVELQGVDKFEYLDLSAPPEKEFGDRRAITLPDKNTRQVNVQGIEAVFEDGTVWSAPKDAEWLPLPAQATLESCLSDQGLIQQYLRETTRSAEYVPDTLLDIWRCTCGQINRNGHDVCRKCGVDRGKAVSALDREQLILHKTAYDEQERRNREEESKRNEVIKKKRVKKWLIIGPIIAALLICGLVVKHVRDKSIYEQGAAACLEEQYYYGAIVNYLLAKDYQGVADTICGLQNETPRAAIIGNLDSFAVLYDDGVVRYYSDSGESSVSGQNDLSVGYYLVKADDYGYLCTLEFDEKNGRLTVSYK
ncbi:MAG: hypothetical protein IK116_04835 [Firmicutes bacterium]|nr:hypothetical protein [Bacillota bacterium]